MSARGVLEASISSTPRSSPPQPSQAAISAAEVRLRHAGLPLSVLARLDGSGTFHNSLVQWISVAAGPAPPEVAVVAVEGVDRQEAWALGILCHMVKVQHSGLDETVRMSTAMLIKQGTSSTAEGGGTIRAHQNMLLAVAKGAVMAVKATTQRLSRFC